MKGFIMQLKDDKELVVLQVGKSIVLELPHLAGVKEHGSILLELKLNDFKALANKLKELADIVWGIIDPKEATTEASDYVEYYDKELDNNGYFSFNVNKGFIQVSQVSDNNSRIYKFSKRKMQSLLFDLDKEVAE